MGDIQAGRSVAYHRMNGTPIRHATFRERQKHSYIIDKKYEFLQLRVFACDCCYDEAVVRVTRSSSGKQLSRSHGKRFSNNYCLSISPPGLPRDAFSISVFVAPR